MLITKKRHNEIVDALSKENHRLSALLIDQSELKSLLRSSQGKSCELLERLTDTAKNFLSFSSNSIGPSAALNLPDDVARFVPDHFGGRVIRQEATRVIEIDPDGNISTGLTKRPPDAGFSYILNRKQTNQ